MEDFGQVNRIVRELHKSCQLSNGSDDPTKGTYLLEVYALEIQVCAGVCVGEGGGGGGRT